MELYFACAKCNAICIIFNFKISVDNVFTIVCPFCNTVHEIDLVESKLLEISEKHSNG